MGVPVNGRAKKADQPKKPRAKRKDTVIARWSVQHPRPALTCLRGKLLKAAAAGPKIHPALPVRLEVVYEVDSHHPTMSAKTRNLYHLSAPSAPQLTRACMDVLAARGIVRRGQVVETSATKLVVHAQDEETPTEHGPSTLHVQLVSVDFKSKPVAVRKSKLKMWALVKAGGHISRRRFNQIQLKIMETRVGRKLGRVDPKVRAHAEAVAAAKAGNLYVGPAPAEPQGPTTAEKAVAIGKLPALQKPKPAPP